MIERLFINTPDVMLADKVEAISSNQSLGEIDRVILQEVAHRLRELSLSKLSPREQAFARQRE